MSNNNMYTFQCAVYMGEEGVSVYSEDRRIIDLFNHGSFIPFIPEWRVEMTKVKTAATLMCYFSNQVSIGMRSENNFFISGPFEELLIANTIPYLIHYILEAERAKRGKATIHAAAVSKNNNGVLILGKQGSGKTSITLELCRKYGYSLIGNDLVLVGFDGERGHIYGGTKILRLRSTTIKDYNKDLKRFFGDDKENDDWTNITIIKPDDIQVATEKQVVPIQAIYYVHLYSSHHNFFIKEVDKLFSKIYLYQIFSEYIRGSAIIPLVDRDLKFSNYLPSLDNEVAFEKRIKFINWIINNKNYKYISGQLADICTFIDGHR